MRHLGGGLLALAVAPALLAQTATLRSDHATYLPGEPIAISFANGPGNSLDWIGIYPDGVAPGPGSTAWVYVSGSQTAGAGLKEGKVTFATGLNLAGDWDAFLLVNDGYDPVGSVKFSVVDPSTPLVRANKAVYGLGEAISITFTNGPANPRDWIGIYRADQVPAGGGNSTLWAYVDGTQNGNVGKDNGSVSFSAGLSQGGSYVVYLLLNDGYDVLASEPFEVLTVAAQPRVVSTTPADGATEVSPVPAYQATLANGTTKVTTGSVNLKLDGAPVTPQVTTAGDQVKVSYQGTAVLPAGSVHQFLLTFADNAVPPQLYSNLVSYTVVNYQSIQLPTPIVLETFDATPEGSLPAGWTEKNYTEITTPDLDPSDLNSAFFAGWTVVNVDRFRGEFTPYSNPGAPQADREDYHRVLTENPRYVVNGKLVSPMASGRMLFANSGYRNGRSQVQYLYTPDFNLSGKTDVYLSFHSLWEQNQDSLAAIEYSTDAGTTWLPVAYYLDEPDIRRDASNNVDAEATFNTSGGDIAMYTDPDTGEDHGGTYGAFIAAPIAPALAPYIQGRRNDDPKESKRVELYRLTQADNKAKVRLRFANVGSDSWYFGIDEVGLYSIPQQNPPTITAHPASQTVYAGDTMTLTVTAGGVGPFTYQWSKDGAPVSGVATASLTVDRASAGTAGEYRVRVTNAAGGTDSNPATVTVQPLPDVVQGVWNFGAEHLGRTSGVGTLEFADGDGTATITGFEQGPPPIGGANAAFMRVPAFQDAANGYDLTMPTKPVGSEESINRYTMVWDLLSPGDINWTPLFNTAPGNGNDADFYISDTGALGIGALGYSADGVVVPDTWYRVTFAANLGAGRATIYVNGAPVRSRTGTSLAGGRFALYSGNDAGPDVRLFNEGDSSGVYTHELLVNSFAFISRELTPDEVAAMGGPSAAGVTLPVPATPIQLAVSLEAGGNLKLTWTGGSGPYQVQKRTSLGTNWANFGSPTAGQTMTDITGGTSAFYRVVGQ